MTKIVLFGKEAREKIQTGLNIAANAVKSTLGSKGRNAFIDDQYLPKITNDGVTIANSIVLEDPFENMGAWLVKNTSSQTNDDVGDGTSTTAVLLQSIIEEAEKRPENPMDIRRDLETVGKRVVQYIKDMSRPVKDNQIESVATISAESEMIGKLIAKILEDGKRTIPISIEDNKFSPEVEFAITEGLETKYGYAHPLFITNQKEGIAEYEDVAVFASAKRISALVEIKGLMEQLDANKISTIVFLVADIDNAALGQLVFAKANGQFNSLVIKINQANDLEDMAAAAGCTLVSDESGLKLSEVKIEHLGKAKRITVSDRKTVIVNTCEKAKHHAQFLHIASSNNQNIYEKQMLEARADRLEGGVAVIKVGAHSDTEREYLKHKIEDAVNATKSALEEGLVEGGGMCLYRISNKLKGHSVGEQILCTALKAPLKAIIENAGEDYTAIIKRLPNKKGYNADNGHAVDMFAKGIVDPAKVSRCAFQNALSTAGTFITHGVAIADKPKQNEAVKS